MIGTIIGDFCGSRWEKKKPPLTKEFDLVHPSCSFTDDTVLTMSVADSLLNKVKFEVNYKNYYRKYPNAGYGSNFKKWVNKKDAVINSIGNGAAMRVSPIAHYCSHYSGSQLNSKEQLISLIKKSVEKTHFNLDSFEGAFAIAYSIFLTKKTKLTKQQIIEEVSKNLSETYADLPNALKKDRPEFDATCNGTVPQALWAFYHGSSFEDTLKLAIMIGGDVDTIAAMAGGIAFNYYGSIPTYLLNVVKKLPKEMKLILNDFNLRYIWRTGLDLGLNIDLQEDETEIRHPYIEI